ncbi:MAG: hypothetical protein DI535_02225 [Citrobacter freundii]|nr:MAG: hypothetical protein DI535_02225 [Citrobacter freundii]
MLESNAANVLIQGYNLLLDLKRKSGEPMPINKGANRRLDCEVVRYVHEANRKNQFPPYDSVRSAFMEGKPVYPGSNFTDKLHIEVCVRKPDLIKGYFLPQPIEKYNPFLKKDFLRR